MFRIMRKILPPHTKISDDAKKTIQECVSEYMSFITAEANDHCQRPLTQYLHRYREFDDGERGSLKRVVNLSSFGFLGFPPAAFNSCEFFGAAPMNGFLKDPVSVSRPTIEPFPQCKEQF
ncbi:hypothetical protein ACJIZ3_012846 [Penstemon smallii]|uniref:Transcription factor CBF/NF-Y/archaeal histone domain-containing protein n=1 Tax=Penstemon smallii TaxID=265156 RepID=A0ABD3UN84_9LAMI